MQFGSSGHDSPCLYVLNLQVEKHHKSHLGDENMPSSLSARGNAQQHFHTKARLWRPSPYWRSVSLFSRVISKDRPLRSVYDSSTESESEIKRVRKVWVWVHMNHQPFPIITEIRHWKVICKVSVCVFAGQKSETLEFSSIKARWRKPVNVWETFFFFNADRCWIHWWIKQ